MNMIEIMNERANEQQNWFQSLKENSTIRQKKKEIREREKIALEEENARFRSFVNQGR